MNWEDKLVVTFWSILLAGMAMLVILLGLYMATDKPFEGYYLCGGQIYAAFDNEADVRAMDYSPEMWNYIIENNLHVEKEDKDEN